MRRQYERYIMLSFSNCLLSAQSQYAPLTSHSVQLNRGEGSLGKYLKNIYRVSVVEMIQDPDTLLPESLAVESKYLFRIKESHSGAFTKAFATTLFLVTKAAFYGQLSHKSYLNWN